jgi:predicted methyltransferase|tara:strand:- start:3973 stop:4188 length:216 start_codon:yes stop_codon:yes gene_type:complete
VRGRELYNNVVYLKIQNKTMKANQVIQGDCLEVMKDMPDKGVDMVLCDLPYGTTGWDRVIPFEPLWTQYKL